MATASPIELESLRRDWIDGMSADELHKRTSIHAEALEGRSLTIIREECPIAFAVEFFAAVSKRIPIALANPNWGAREQLQFDGLMKVAAPAPGSILIPTGGTTGGVKLAIHDWMSLQSSARAAQNFLGGGPVDACCVLPLHHVSGLMQLIRAYVSGGHIRFDEQDVRGRCLSLVPTQLQRMLQPKGGIEKLNTARVVFVGGAAMPEAVERQARELKLPIVPVYGMTETAAMIAAIPNADFLAGPGAGAVPLGDARFSIDKDGSIRIHSRSLFKGYQGGQAPDLAHGYRTGDTGWMDENGRLYLLGRMDQLINSGGEKVDPAEVREALLRLSCIREARVVGEPDEEWGERVVAYVTLAGDVSAFSQAAVQEALRGELSPFKIPKRIRLCDGLQCTKASTRHRISGRPRQWPESRGR